MSRQPCSRQRLPQPFPSPVTLPRYPIPPWQILTKAVAQRSLCLFRRRLPLPHSSPRSPPRPARHSRFLGLNHPDRRLAPRRRREAGAQRHRATSHRHCVFARALRPHRRCASLRRLGEVRVPAGKAACVGHYPRARGRRTVCDETSGSAEW